MMITFSKSFGKKRATRRRRGFRRDATQLLLDDDGTHRFAVANVFFAGGGGSGLGWSSRVYSLSNKKGEIASKDIQLCLGFLKTLIMWRVFFLLFFSSIER